MKLLRSFIAIVFCSLTAISIGCSNEEPLSLESENSSESSSTNPDKRTPEEAIRLAIDSYNAFYGDSELSSRSSKGLIDFSSSPVKIISSNPMSRATASDTCLYVINFADDNGFAIIAANRNVSPLIGISDSGNYDSDMETENSGLAYYLGRAKEYLSNLNEPSISTLDITVERDDRVQVKEWEDSTFSINIPRRVNNSWAPGITKKTDDELILSTSDNNPTGCKFSTYNCGEGVIAIAHSLLYFAYPSKINATSHPKDASAESTPVFYPNWQNISRHRKNFTSTYAYSCTKDEKEACHEQIATLCRAIGNLSECQKYGTLKNPPIVTSLDGITKAIIALGFHTRPWAPFQNTTRLSDSREIIVVNGWITDIAETSHFWIIDGEKKFTARHHYATKEWGQSWKETITATYSKDLVHINWGKGGKGNGWYEKGPFIPNDSPTTEYLDPFFTVISLPNNL